MALVTVVGVAALLTARSAQRDLVDAGLNLERARDAVDQGDVEGAADAFAESGRAASTAVAALHTPQLNLAGFLPVIGDSVRSATATAEAATLIADAGTGLFQEVAALPGGLDALTPREQRVPTELAGLADGFERAHQLITLAGRIVDSAPADTTVDEVDDARALLMREIEVVLPRLQQLAALSRAVPAFLGADGPRRYFVGAQNPAELRGTGGLIGAFAIMTVEDGRIEIGDFASISTLENDLPPPAVSNPDYLERYAGHLQPGFGARWSNINFTPDVPTAAEAILSSYRTATREELHGVVVVDPYALQALMRVTGPTMIPRIGRVTADDVVEVVTNRAPEYFDSSGERKETLGDVATGVVDDFLTGGHDPADQARALADAVAGGHTLLFSVDAEVQADLEAAGLGGALGAAEPGFLAVFGNNLSESKLDYYLDRHVRYELFPNPDGSANAVIEVTLTNLAPVSGSPEHVIGSSQDLGLAAGENLTSVSVYCGPCELVSSTRSRDYLGVFREHELGHTVLETWERIPPSASAQTRFVVRIPTLWSRRGQEGSLAVSFQDQPTIRPTRLSVIVHPVAGWRLVPERVDMGVGDDGAAVWDGDARPFQSFPVDLISNDATTNSA